ncbi:hypothetical protein KIPB_005725 [Kipferlia bialata]|uniref:LisH domain-containing protein n=1 Tax=Kipferlia bialata TaxID=797122 RepID=A0A9K3GIH1_9EUKA|nr:hypothetical protein KIPB_005725 [Kipferlia bialata]|eukprot:g5725.t1
MDDPSIDGIAELRQQVGAALNSSGVMSQMRAYMRAHVWHVLEDETPQFDEPLFTPPSPLASEEVPLVHLVGTWLRDAGLRRTSTVFDAESTAIVPEDVSDEELPAASLPALLQLAVQGGSAEVAGGADADSEEGEQGGEAAHQRAVADAEAMEKLRTDLTLTENDLEAVEREHEADKEEWAKERTQWESERRALEEEVKAAQERERGAERRRLQGEDELAEVSMQVSSLEQDLRRAKDGRREDEAERQEERAREMDAQRDRDRDAERRLADVERAAAVREAQAQREIETLTQRVERLTATVAEREEELRVERERSRIAVPVVPVETELMEGSGGCGQ